VIVGRYGEIVEALAWWSRQIEFSHLLESKAARTGRECRSSGQGDKSGYQNSFLHNKAPSDLFRILLLARHRVRRDALAEFVESRSKASG